MNGKIKIVKTYLDNFAKVISDVVNADVIITDSRMTIVGSAFQHFSLYNDINVGSLIAEVLYQNRDVVIEDKANVESCRACEQFRECKMKGFIGVPVPYENQTIGTIALILPKFKVKELFDKLDSSLSFMHSMAELVAIRMTTMDETERLHKKVNQIEGLMRSSNEAIVYTDSYGNIILSNDTFNQYFRIRESIEGQKLQEILEYPYIQTYLEGDREEIKNRKASFSHCNHVFYGTMNTRRIYANDQDYGIMFSFRKFSEIHRDSNMFTRGTYVTFEWLRQICDEPTIQLARSLANEDGPMLIHSDDNIVNEMLAKAIYNYSKRRLQDLRVIYLMNVYKELLEAYLFDETGFIRNMDKGTLIMLQPEQIPMIYQDMLAEYMETGVLVYHGSRIKSNVRLIFCTTEDLGSMVKAGNFSERLFLAISKSQITGGNSVHTDFQMFRRFVSYLYKYYCLAYKKPMEELPLGDIETMWHDLANRNVNQIGITIERLVASGGSPKMAESAPLSSGGSVQDKKSGLKELEKKEICALVESGCSQKEICSTLGISRTTLYRRMKQYGIIAFGENSQTQGR